MTKPELVAKVAEITEGSKKDAAVYLDAVVEAIKESVIDGEKVTLAGFGSFAAIDRPEREARNPQTGETLIVEAHRAVKFKVGSAFKEAVK